MSENVNFKKKETLSENEKSEIMSIYSLCNTFDDYDYYFCIEDDCVSYYLCYEGNSMIGIVSMIPYDEDFCLYGLIHPKFRRRHIMTNLLNFITDDLKNCTIHHSKMPESKFCHFVIPTVRAHIPDRKQITNETISIPTHIHSLLSNTGFTFSHHEYLMEYNFSSPILNNDLSNNNGLLEVEFDEDENEFQFWLSDTYIGGCNIMPFYDENYVTFYNFEIISEFRSKGYGRAGFISILNELRNKNFNKLILHVSGENIIAHSLYASCGLKVNSSFSVYKKNIAS